MGMIDNTTVDKYIFCTLTNTACAFMYNISYQKRFDIKNLKKKSFFETCRECTKRRLVLFFEDILTLL